MSDVLTLAESSAGRWFARHLPPLHVVLGDSIARDAKFRSRFSHHDFLQLATGGATWRSTELKLTNHLEAWRREATVRGRRLGTAIVWHSGNDVYHRSTRLPHYDEETLSAAAKSASGIINSLLQEAEAVVVFGPLPRLRGETGPDGMWSRPWEHTAAFHLERRLRHRLPRGAVFVRMGGLLTRKYAGRSSIFRGCAHWYAEDGVHMTEAGYARLADSPDLPVWIVVGAGIKD